MSSLVLIPWPETAWSAEDRICGRSPVPLTEAGRAQAQSWGQALDTAGVTFVYSGPEQAAVETARAIAERCRVKSKAVEDLAEVDVGLWDGLAEEALKRSSPKAYKTWREDPASICPPEGEDLKAAHDRLREGLGKLSKKHGDRTVALVLGPLAFAITRCIVESDDLSNVRSLKSDEPVRYTPAGRAARGE